MSQIQKRQEAAKRYRDLVAERDRLLAELGQAKRERDEAQNYSALVAWRRDALQATERAEKAAARLAKVPALVQALRAYAHDQVDGASARDALAAWERDTQAAHTARGHATEERTG